MVEVEEAATAVRIARAAIAARFASEPPRDPAAPFRNQELPAVFDDRRGVFVTLRRHPSGHLRGCIGYPLPVHALRIAVPRVAVSAAFDDPRFPPLGAVELPKVTLEVSVLTVPRRIATPDPEARVEAVRVGEDGLIVEAVGESGLLLPQVAVEQGWDARQFLDGTCEKAGLPRAAWRRPETEVFRFQAEVFEETTPEGEVRRESLTPPTTVGPAPRA